MKRIIFCAHKRFPRGDAGANRVLYMAKSMIYAGFEVIVIGSGNDANKDFDGPLSEYNGVKYINTPVPTEKLRNLTRSYCRGKSAVKIMEALNVSKEDNVIIYSSSYEYILPVLKYVKKNNIPTYFDVVERHQRFQIENRIAWYRYRLGFKQYHKSGNVIAISENIKEYFEIRAAKLSFYLYLQVKRIMNLLKKTEKTKQFSYIRVTHIKKMI